MPLSCVLCAAKLAGKHVADWVISGKADVGIATEGLTQFKELISFPCYEWSHVLVAPMATENSRQNCLRSIEISHLLASNVIRLMIRAWRLSTLLYV